MRGWLLPRGGQVCFPSLRDPTVAVAQSLVLKRATEAARQQRDGNTTG